MHPMLDIAINAARSAGRIIVQFLDRLDLSDISQKTRSDFVTKADQLSEQEIIRVIHQAYPNHSILAEESGHTVNDEKITWIIDPLDGTTNFIHGYPQFSISIAVQINNRLEVGVVYDPLTHELFTAARGKGAQLNSKRIRVTGCSKLDYALLGTGFPVKNPEIITPYLKSFATLLPKSSGIRRAGSVALDLSYLAAGRLDGFWEALLKPWDLAAGLLLVTEAGGMISDFDGKMNILESGNVIASTPRLHAPILAAVQDAFKE